MKTMTWAEKQLADPMTPDAPLPETGPEKIAREMGEEIHADLTHWGFHVSTEVCHQAAVAHLAEDKEAAASILRAAGVPVTCKTNNFNGCKCGTWSVGKHTLFIG